MKYSDENGVPTVAAVEAMHAAQDEADANTRGRAFAQRMAALTALAQTLTSAITLGQPMASAIFDADTPKRVENRPRCLFHVGGVPRLVAIHAGLRDFPFEESWLTASSRWPSFHDDVPELPRGAILGVVEVLADMRFAHARRAVELAEVRELGEEMVKSGRLEPDALPAADPRTVTDLALARAILADPWAAGPHCYLIGRRWKLDEPLPARGMQGLWTLGTAARTILRAGVELAPCA